MRGDERSIIELAKPAITSGKRTIANRIDAIAIKKSLSINVLVDRTLYNTTLVVILQFFLHINSAGYGIETISLNIVEAGTFVQFNGRKHRRNRIEANRTI